MTSLMAGTKNVLGVNFDNDKATVPHGDSLCRADCYVMWA